MNQINKTSKSTYSLLFGLYISQYLPVAFFTGALPAIIMMEGGKLGDLAYAYLLGIIWSLKFLWAPIIDRYSLGNKINGHYRRWLLLLQSSLVVLIAICAIPSIQPHSSILLCIMIAVCFLSSTQDIASDALAVNLLDKQKRGMGNGIQSAGGLIGQMIGGGIILILYPYLGWSLTFIILAFMVMIPLFQVAYFYEPPGYQNSTTARFSYMFSALKQKKIIYVILINILLNSAMMVSFAFLMPGLMRNGWGLEQIGLSTNIIGPIFGIITALCCGYLVKKKGLSCALFLVVILQITATCLALLFLDINDTWRLIICIIQLMSFGATMCFVFTLSMNHCKQNNGGSTFSLLVCIVTLFSSILAAFSLTVAETFGINNIRYITIFGTLLAVFIAFIGKNARIFHESES